MIFLLVRCLVAVSATLFIVACSASGTHSETHVSNSEPIRDLQHRGWLPDWFPQSAVNVVEAHDMDTNEVLVSLDASASVRTTLLDGAEELDPKAVKFPSRSVTSETKWPTSDVVKNVSNRAWKAYSRGSEPNVTWTICDGGADRIYMWGSPRSTYK